MAQIRRGVVSHIEPRQAGSAFPRYSGYVKLLALVFAIAAAGCSPAATDPGARDPAPTAVADAIAFGGCAPVRYRSIEPGEVETHVARTPPPPMRFTVTPPFTRLPAHKAAASTIAGQLRRAKSEIQKCVGDELEAGQSLNLRVNVTVHTQGVQVASLRGVSDHRQRRCAELAVRRVVKAKLASGRAILNFRISIRATGRSNPTAPQRKRGTVEILSSSDLASESLALSASVLTKRTALNQCLKTTAQRGAGHAIATLTLEDGAVSAAEVQSSDAEKLSHCWASALSGLAAGGVPNGSFRCALSYGGRGMRPVDLVLHTSDKGLVVGGRAPVSIHPGEVPPNSELYRRLLEARFADVHPSPAPAWLVVSPDVAGETIVAITTAAKAADIEIRGVDVAAAKSDFEPIRPDLPAPRLGQLAARVARVTAIIDGSQVWLGLAEEVGAKVITLTDNASIKRHLATLSKTPGVSQRRDAVVGVEAGTPASAFAPLLQHLKDSGFDQISVVSSESARARLAH